MSINAIYNLMVSDYDERMMHRIPSATSVVRHEYILPHCIGKTVLDIGGSGQLHDMIKDVASKCVSVDKHDADYCVDLDNEKVPLIGGIELVVCGEVIEHLSNPGFFLDGLHEYTVPIIFTVPNSFTDLGTKWIRKGIENVNKDHVAYYSYTTFTRLLSRHGFIVDKFFWYNGNPGTAEGLVFMARAN